MFLRSKRRESLLAHTKVPIPEPQKRALIVTPGSDSSLAVSKALSSRSGSKPLASSSSPLASPSGYRPPRQAQRLGKCSASSLRSGGRKRFKGGKGSAPSSKPSGFRK